MPKSSGDNQLVGLEQEVLGVFAEILPNVQLRFRDQLGQHFNTTPALYISDTQLLMCSTFVFRIVLYLRDPLPQCSPSTSDILYSIICICTVSQIYSAPTYGTKIHLLPIPQPNMQPHIILQGPTAFPIKPDYYATI